MTLPLWTVSCWRWRVREPIDQTRSCFKATLEKDQVSEVDLDRKDRIMFGAEWGYGGYGLSTWPSGSAIAVVATSVQCQWPKCRFLWPNRSRGNDSAMGTQSV
jgi:hypothetical protein